MVWTQHTHRFFRARENETIDLEPHVSADGPGTPRDERDCGVAEYWFRRTFSSMFYWRGYRKLHPHDPFYVPAAIRSLEALLNDDSRVFEWGSGVSTVWYGRHAAEVVSVEHDGGWYRKTAAALMGNNLSNVELLYTPPAAAPFSSKDEDRPYDGFLCRALDKPEFNDYVRRVDGYPEGFFDCIAVDGRERVGCVAHAVPKVAENGFVILDDSHRPHYREIFDILSDWEAHTYGFGLLQTTIFLKR